MSSSSSSSSVEPPPITNGLILWLTAETRVTQGTDHRVSQWQDALTGFLWAGQSTTAAKPLWVADAFAGRPGLRFTGTESLFINASDMGQNNFTIIVLGRATAQRTSGGTAHGGQRFLICQNFIDGFPAISAGSNGIGIYEFGASPALRAEAVTDASVLCPLTVRYVNRAPTGYLGGTLVCQGTPATGVMCSIPHSIGGDGAGNGFVGDIAEILIYSGAFTEQNRLVVESWLQAKYDCYDGSSDSSQSSGSSDGSDSSDPSESSNSSSSESSDSSESSGDSGGGSSDGSDSSDSSSSESSDSSESSESSSSSSSSLSSSSNGGPSLYFDEDPVYVDWNDTSYDANANLVTNHSPISWSITAQEAAINSYGVVTFGTVGETTTVYASGSPYDLMTLAIIKTAINEVKFTSAHSDANDKGFIIDYDTDYAGASGSPLEFRGWIKSDPGAATDPGKNNAVTHTKGTKVSVTVKIKVEPSGMSFVLSGSSNVTGLSFTSESQTSTGNVQEVTVSGDDALENKVQKIGDASIQWSLTAQDRSISAGDSGPHVIYVTHAKPVFGDYATRKVPLTAPAIPDGAGGYTEQVEQLTNSATKKRMDWVCTTAKGATTDAEAFEKLRAECVKKKHDGGYLNNEEAWKLLDGAQGGDCDDHARWLVLACCLLGIDADMRYIFASTDGDCTRAEYQHYTGPTGLDYKLWLLIRPAVGRVNYHGVVFFQDTFYSVSPEFQAPSSLQALRRLHELGFAPSQGWFKLSPGFKIPWIDGDPFIPVFQSGVDFPAW